MKFRILKTFIKDLKNIRDKKILNQVEEVTSEVKVNVEKISNEEDLSKMKDTKKLKGHENAYRIKVQKDYRIGATYDKDMIEESDKSESRF